jgi:hypothetical protein
MSMLILYAMRIWTINEVVDQNWCYTKSCTSTSVKSIESKNEARLRMVIAPSS